MKINVTKIACAYQHLTVNTPIEIGVDLVVNVIGVPKEAEVGGAVIFLRDGSSVNVVESAEHVHSLLNSISGHWFELGFSRN